MNKIICLLITMACGCAFGQTYQKLDKMDLRNTTSTANHSFTYNQDGVIYSKNSSGAQTGYWNAQTGEFDASIDGSDLDTGTIPVARLPIAARVYEVALSGKPYSTITSALAAATDPATDKIIYIHPGIYDEALTVTVARTHIRGAARDSVIMSKTVSVDGAVIDIMADLCSIEDVTLSCTRSAGTGPYSRCVRVGDNAATPVISKFFMRNCNLKGNQADELWIMASCADAVVDSCEASGTYDVFSTTAQKSQFRNCRVTASSQSAFWVASVATYAPENIAYFKDCYVDAICVVTLLDSTAVLDNILTDESPFAYQFPEDVPQLFISSVGQTSSTVFSRSVNSKAGEVTDGVVQHFSLDPWTYNLAPPAYTSTANPSINIQGQYGQHADGSLRGGDGGHVLLRGGIGGNGNEDERAGHGGNMDIAAGAAGTDNGGGNGNPGTLSLHGTTAIRGDLSSTGTVTLTGGLTATNATVIGLPKTIFVSTAGTTVSNTSSETNFTLTGSGSKTLSANTLTVGKTYRITACGDYENFSGVSSDLAFKMKLGSIAIATMNVGTVAHSADFDFRITGLFTCRSAGSGGSVVANLDSMFFDATASPDTRFPLASTDTGKVINTTASNEIHLSVQHSVADAATLASITLFTVEQLN